SLKRNPGREVLKLFPLRETNKTPSEDGIANTLSPGSTFKNSRTSLSKTTRYRSSTLSTAITHPTILTFLPRLNLTCHGQLGRYNQIGRWLTQEYTWSVGLSTLVISTIPGFSLSILA